ncbi:MAG: fructose-bisphosphatase class III [Weeksellaceae bacterium]
MTELRSVQQPPKPVEQTQAPEVLRPPQVAIGVAEPAPRADGGLALSKNTVFAITSDTAQKAQLELSDPYLKGATERATADRKNVLLANKINNLDLQDEAGKPIKFSKEDLAQLPDTLKKKCTELGISSVALHSTGRSNDSSSIATVLMLDYLAHAPATTSTEDLLKQALTRAHEGVKAFNAKRKAENTNWKDDIAAMGFIVTKNDGETHMFNTVDSEFIRIDDEGKTAYIAPRVSTRLGDSKQAFEPIISKNNKGVQGKVIVGPYSTKERIDTLSLAQRKGSTADIVKAVSSKEAALTNEDKEHVLYAPKVRIVPDTHGLDPAFYGVTPESENVVSIGDIIDTPKNIMETRHPGVYLANGMYQKFRNQIETVIPEKVNGKYTDQYKEFAVKFAEITTRFSLDEQIYTEFTKYLASKGLDRSNFPKQSEFQQELTTGREKNKEHGYTEAKYNAAKNVNIRQSIDVWTKLLATDKANLVLGNHELLAMAGFIGNNDAMRAWLSNENNGRDTLLACGIKIDDLWEQSSESIPDDKFQVLRSRINNNEPLRNFISVLFKKGKMYMIANEALIVHAGVPVDKDGSLIPPQKKGSNGEGVTWSGFADKTGLDAFDDIEKSLRKIGEALTTGKGDGLENEIRTVHLLATGRQDAMSPAWMRKPFFDVMSDDTAAEKAMQQLQAQARKKGASIKGIMIGHTEAVGATRVGKYVFGTDTAVGDVVALELDDKNKKVNVKVETGGHNFGTDWPISYAAEMPGKEKIPPVTVAAIEFPVAQSTPSPEPARPDAPKRATSSTPEPARTPASRSEATTATATAEVTPPPPTPGSSETPPPTPPAAERIDDISKHKIPMYVDNKDKAVDARKFMKQTRVAQGVSLAGLKKAGLEPGTATSVAQVIATGPETYTVVVPSIYEAHKKWATQVVQAARAIPEMTQRTGETEAQHQDRVYSMIRDRLKWQGDYVDDPLRQVIDTVQDPMSALLGNVTPSQIMSLEIMGREALAPPPKMIANPAIAGLRATMQAEPSLDVRSEVAHQGGFTQEEGDWMALIEGNNGKKNPEAMKDVLAADLLIEAAGSVDIDTENRALLDAALAKYGFTVQEGETFQQLLDRLGETIKAADQKSPDRLKARQAYNRAKRHLYERVYASVGLKGTLTMMPVGYESVRDRVLTVAGNLDTARAGTKRHTTDEAKQLLGELRGTDLNDRALKGMEMYLRLIKDPLYLNREVMQEADLGMIYEQQFIQSEAAALKYIVETARPAVPAVTPTPAAPATEPTPTTPATSEPEPTDTPSRDPAPTSTPEPHPQAETEPAAEVEEVIVAPPIEVRPREQTQAVTQTQPQTQTRPALTSLDIAIVSTPNHYVQQTEELADHSFALDMTKEPPPRNWREKLESKTVRPASAFFKKVWQKQLFNNAFKHQHNRFVTDVVRVVHNKLGLNETIPVDVQLSLLDKAIEGGKNLRKTKNPFHRFILNLTDTATGLTGIGQSGDMHMAREWLQSQNADFFKTNVAESTMEEQTLLAEKFAAHTDDLSFEEQNAQLFSKELGEERFKLEDVIPDEDARNEVQQRVRDIIRQYATGQIATREALLSTINTYMLTTLQNSDIVDQDIRKQLNILEMATNVTKVAEEVKLHWADQYAAGFDSMEMNIYFGKGEWGGARGETGAGWYERKLMRRIKERHITRSATAEIQSRLRFAVNLKDAVKDAAGFTAAYIGGGVIGSALNVPGRMVSPVVKWFTMNPLTAAAAVGITNGVVEGGLATSANGSIIGWKGRYLRDFVQVSREAAFGRISGADAKRRLDFEKVFVDWKAADDLANNINVLVTQSKERALRPEELKQLTIRVAEAKARLRLTDVTATRATKIAQNFVRYTEGKENEQLSALRTAILEGVNHVARTSNTGYGDLINAQAVMEAQLRIGTDRNDIIKYTAKQVKELTKSAANRNGLNIDTATAEGLVNSYMDALGNLSIPEGKSLHAAMSCLSKMNTRHATISGLKAAGASLAFGTVGRWAVNEVQAIGAQGGEYLTHWTQINYGQIPVALDAQGNPQVQLTGMQRAYLGAGDIWRKLRPPEQIPDSLYHKETVNLMSGGAHEVTLPPAIKIETLTDAAGNPHQYMVDSRTAQLYDITNHQFDMQDLNNDGKSELVLVNPAGKPKLFTDFFGGGKETQAAGGFFERPPGPLQASTDARDRNGNIVTTHIPPNTHWEADPQKPNAWDLKAADGKVLIENARFDATGNLIKEPDYQVAAEVVPHLTETTLQVNTTETFTNPNGNFDNRLVTPVEKREWYAYNTVGSEENELRLETFKNDNTITLTMEGMTDNLSRQLGLNPENVDVDAVFTNPDERAGFYVSMPGHPNEGVFLPANEQGKFDFNINDTTNYVSFPDGTKMTVADFSRMMINPQAYTPTLENGNIATELTGRQWVFNIGDPEGKNGFISAGRLMKDANGNDVFQSFATIRGCGGLVDQFDTTTGHTELQLDIKSVPGEGRFDFESATIEGPKLYAIPIYWRENVERSSTSAAGANTRRTPSVISNPNQPQNTSANQQTPAAVNTQGRILEYNEVMPEELFAQVGVDLAAIGTANYRDRAELVDSINHYAGFVSQNAPAETEQWRNRLVQALQRQYPQDYLQKMADIDASIAAKARRAPTTQPPQNLAEAQASLQPEGARPLESRFALVQGPVNPRQPYYVQQVPNTSDLQVTDADIRNLRLVKPFVVNINGQPRVNRAVVPYVFTLGDGNPNEAAQDKRFLNGEATTNNDSGLFGLAAASAANPQAQALLYKDLAAIVLKVHQRDQALLGEWLQVQKQPIPGLNGMSVNLFLVNDVKEGPGVNNDLKKLLSKFDNGSQTTIELTPNEVTTMWQQRIQELERVLVANAVQPHHLRWIEFLSHSVDKDKMIDLVKRQAPTAPPATSNSTPISRAEAVVDTAINRNVAEQRSKLEAFYPPYALMYDKLMQDYPEMQSLYIALGTPQQYSNLEYTAGIWLRPTAANPTSGILLHQTDQRALAEKLIRERRQSVLQSVELINMAGPSIERNPELLTTFIALHEFGHAHYFLNKYKNSSDPLAAYQLDRQREMDTLPVKGLVPPTVKKMLAEGTLQQYYDTHKERLSRDFYIDTIDELVQQQERIYRNLPSEKYPNEFAAAFMKRHAAEMGWQIGGIAAATTEAPARTRAENRLSSEPINFNQQNRIILPWAYKAPFYEEDKPDSNNVVSHALQFRAGREIMKFSAATSGGGIRSRDEDSILIAEGSDGHLTRWSMAAIFDGMGGHANGDNASFYAAKRTEQLMTDYMEGRLQPTHINRDRLNAGDDAEVQKLLDYIGSFIQNEAGSIDDVRGGGTTASMIFSINDKFFAANIGDSRIYKQTSQGLSQVTTDDNVIYQKWKNGVISPTEAKNDPYRNVITKELLTQGARFVIQRLDPLQPGEAYLLTCDGVPEAADQEYTDNPTRLQGMLKTARKQGNAAQNFIQRLLADNNGKTKDNISCIVIEPQVNSLPRG